ncbi:MAG: hypothetical protein AAFN16_10925, partial [Pseudomonadota bacterium]
MNPVLPFVHVFLLVKGPEFDLPYLLQRSFKAFFLAMGVIRDMPQQITVRQTEMPLTRRRVRTGSEYSLLQQSIDPATDADDTQKGPDIPRLNSV